MRLGKHDYKHDDRTAQLGSLISPTLVYPLIFDFDKGRAGFPLKSWGNDEWADCVLAGRANHVLRLERVEQRVTLALRESDVISEYQRLCQEQFNETPQSPGDQFDNGLVVLDAIRSWRNEGWRLELKTRPSNIQHVYFVAAYGEIDPTDFEQVKAAIYLLHGVELGFQLPRAVMGKYDIWDYQGETGPEWRPGSWGGHLVYSKAYRSTDVEIITWGQKVRVTSSFLAKYCDEAWAVVDNFDSWKKSPSFDIQALLKHLRDIGAKNITS